MCPRFSDQRTFSSYDLRHRDVDLEPTAGVRLESSIDCQADWFERCFEQAGQSVDFRLPETDKQGTSAVPFQIATRLLFCQLGDWVLGRFPLRVARLSGHESRVPDEESTYDRLFDQILTREPDAIYLDSIKPQTLLWQYLQSSPLIQRSFRCYSQRGPVPHWLIRLDGSFSNYMKQLPPKTRKNRLREIKILRELGDVKLIRVTEASEVDVFLKAAYDISQKTRQFKRFGWGIAARDPGLVKNELLRLAQHGWLRSYLLTCGNVPCSYILGQQSGSRFRPVAAGVDPAWRGYSAGTALLLLVLEDLFKENPPDFYDLGTSAEHKEYLATDSYLEADVWLFRRKQYATLVSSIYRVCNLMSQMGGATLARFGLKEIAKQLMRRMDFVTCGKAISTSWGNTQVE